LDHTETLDSLKKELFNIEFKIRMSREDKEMLHKLMRERYIIKQKYDLLLEEEQLSEGQISFGFADQIDVEQLKGRM